MGPAMFGQNRDALRRFFISAWQKRMQDQPLQPLERLVAQVIEQHPEYHRHLAEDQVQRDFAVEQGDTNPWLHMGMHITLGEQVAADRPAGIRERYQALVRETGDNHAAEHKMMDCLGLVLWEAQRDARNPDDAAYLACLQQLLRRPG
jgi:hypothetical protein